MRNGLGWRWFAAWAAAGALVVFSFLSLASIGLFIFPFALVASWLVARGSPGPLPALGVLSGAGLVCFAIAALDGFATYAWLVVGIVLTLAGAAAFAAVRCRDERAAVG